MTIKRLLIFAPLVLIIILLQSYFWVPTYEQQTRGNPDRLSTYVTASTGDASLLNPILSADSASSEIASQVFEGLIDRDQNLQYRGRVASGWEIYEEAYFFVNPIESPSGTDSTDPQSVADLIRSAKASNAPMDPRLRATLDRITNITVLPPQRFSATRKAPDATTTSPATDINFRVDAPARIKLRLSEVDQDLFDHLQSLLGESYFEAFENARYLQPDQPLPAERLEAYARDILPTTEQNPVIVFHLRPGVHFHDGHPLGADDVRFTYDAIMNPQNLSPRTSDYEPVKTVEVIDPLTVRIVYKRLYSPAIGTWQMGILPEHLLNREALRKEALARGLDPQNFSVRDSNFNRRPIGCGPFKFKEWQSDQYILLDRFQEYWDGPPNYETFAYRIIPNVLTQEMEFYAGTVDNYSVQPFQVARLRADSRFQNFSGLSFGYTYIGYNMRREPFNDRRVRLALGMAIDVEKIIKFVLYGQGERITGPFPKQTDYYDNTIPPVPYDPQGALRLLAEAGWNRNSQGWLEKDGKRLSFTLITNSGNNIRRSILAIAQDAWKQIGIDVSTDLLEWSVFIQERVNKLDFDAIVLGWSMGIDPDLYQIWHSSQTKPNLLNFVAFKNKAADDLIIKIRQEYNHQKLVADCHRLHEIIAAEQPYTFLYVGKWTAVLDKRIVIKTVDDDGQTVYEKITPTKTGNFMFYFNKWIKLSEVPVFNAEG
ncbi:MAG: ABC transporter substrate-binding protein [Desulfobacterales bacterium]